METKGSGFTLCQTETKDDVPCNSDRQSISTESFNEQGCKSLKVKQLELIKAEFDATWFKCALIFFTFLLGMAQNLDFATRSIYTGYATSSFSQHSLLSTAQVINQVIGSVAQIIFARLSDHFGRLYLLLAALLFHLVGIVIESQAYDTGRYAAGTVFWFAGYIGIHIQLLLIMSDFSSLKWRLLFQYAPVFPYVIITWIIGSIVKAANPTLRWSWDIGMWAFILPISSIPLVTLLSYAHWKTTKTDRWKLLMKQNEKKDSLLHRLNHTFWNLDTIGLVLITISLACILVPLTLAGGTSEKWRDGRIIAVLVVGAVLLPVFLVYESFCAVNPLLSINQVKDRGVWAPFCSSICSSIIYLLATDYLYPVLLVSMNQSSSTASMILYLPSLMGVVPSPIISFLLSKIRRTKPFALFGTVIYAMSAGLFYRYRGGLTSRSGVVAASLCLGLGSSLLNYILLVSVQALSTHDQMGTITALYMALSSVGVQLVLQLVARYGHRRCTRRFSTI